jgi:hypothetical protein
VNTILKPFILKAAQSGLIVVAANANMFVQIELGSHLYMARYIQCFVLLGELSNE